MFLSLSQIKKHLNIDASFTDDDNYLLSLADVAAQMVEAHIDKPLNELTDGEGNLPAPLVHAMLLLVGNFYANRESVTFASAQPLPHAFDLIINLYQNYSHREVETS